MVGKALMKGCKQFTGFYRGSYSCGTFSRLFLIGNELRIVGIELLLEIRIRFDKFLD